MRLGILGGSFDPPHTGHLLIAQDAIDALGLDRLLIVPAATQPLKLHAVTPAADRLEMTSRCFEGVKGATVDPVEISRGGLSFMVDTVESFRAKWPDADLHLLVGEDVVATLPRWRDVERLLSMVRLVVLRRAASTSGDVAAALADWEARPGIRPTIQLATRQVDVSSTEIRTRVREGRSIRGFVPDAVADYIESTGLYLQQPVVAEDPAGA